MVSPPKCPRPLAGIKVRLREWVNTEFKQCFGKAVRLREWASTVVWFIINYFSWQFIQPQGQAPKTTLTLVIPPMDVNFLCPLTFYLRQNLSQLLFLPRYMDSDPSHHFKAVSGSKTEATGCANGESSRLQPEIYLYNRPHSSGGKGLRSRY